MAQISLSRKLAPVKQYLSMVRKAIEEPKYPTPESRSYGLIGNITFGFDILGNGEFRSIRIMESSGDELLDRTAVEAIERGSGKIKRPQVTGHRTIKTSVVINTGVSVPIDDSSLAGPPLTRPRRRRRFTSSHGRILCPSLRATG